ncbi:hypothetical protein ACHWQZ_G017785 [Mnemiopsis leidyi]
MLKLPLLLLHIFLVTKHEDVKIIPRLLKLWEVSTETQPGVHKEEKIFWGLDADASSAPYQILLSYGENGLCGGAIIDSSWVLTAAHCTVLQEKILDIGMFTISAGTLHLHSLSESSQKRHIDMVFPHENYDDESLSHDIALLHLKNPLILTENVSAITIADSLPEPGSSVRASGYGTTETGDVSVTLKYIDQDVPTRIECLNIFGSLLDETMWCSGDDEMKKRSGVGDSGGPLVQIQNGDSKLVGLVSYSIDGPDGKPVYDVNCDVTKMKPWIAKMMNRTVVELEVKKEPQMYTWSSKGRNYQAEFIKMKCHTGKYCRVQVKSMSIDFGGDTNSEIKMYHGFDLTEFPLISLTSSSYSAIQAESGFASNRKVAMLTILTGQEAVTVDVSFTYQVLDDSSCRLPSSQCNEVPDCIDLSDEIGCIYPNKTKEEMSDNAVGCYPSDFRCPNVGHGVWCVRQSHVCNGYHDCVGGADESAQVCRAHVGTLSLWVIGVIWLICF